MAKLEDRAAALRLKRMLEELDVYESQEERHFRQIDKFEKDQQEKVFDLTKLSVGLSIGILTLFSSARRVIEPPYDLDPVLYVVFGASFFAFLLGGISLLKQGYRKTLSGSGHVTALLSSYSLLFSAISVFSAFIYIIGNVMIDNECYSNGLDDAVPAICREFASTIPHRG